MLQICVPNIVILSCQRRHVHNYHCIIALNCCINLPLFKEFLSPQAHLPEYCCLPCTAAIHTHSADTAGQGSSYFVVVYTSHCSRYIGGSGVPINCVYAYIQDFARPWVLYIYIMVGAHRSM